LKEKFFTRCELQGTSCKFLEKRRKDEIVALSSKVTRTDNTSPSHLPSPLKGEGMTEEEWIPTFVGMTYWQTGMTERESFLKYLLQLEKKWSKIAS